MLTTGNVVCESSGCKARGAVARAGRAARHQPRDPACDVSAWILFARTQPSFSSAARAPRRPRRAQPLPARQVPRAGRPEGRTPLGRLRSARERPQHALLEECGGEARRASAGGKASWMKRPRWETWSPRSSAEFWAVACQRKGPEASCASGPFFALRGVLGFGVAFSDRAVSSWLPPAPRGPRRTGKPLPARGRR